MMKTIIVLLFFYCLSGCTVAGAIIDGQAQSQARNDKNSISPAQSTPYKNPLEPVPTDKNGFNFTDMGLKIDSALVSLVKGESTTTQVCRQVTKSLKECVEVEKSSLHTNEAKQLKTDDEIISVGQ